MQAVTQPVAQPHLLLDDMFEDEVIHAVQSQPIDQPAPSATYSAHTFTTALTAIGTSMHRGLRGTRSLLAHCWWIFITLLAIIIGFASATSEDQIMDRPENLRMHLACGRRSAVARHLRVCLHVASI